MRKLIETSWAQAELMERDKAKLPSGVLCRGVWPICNIDKPNSNNRVYEKDVYQKVMDDDGIKEKMANRTLYGEPEHPEETSSNLFKTSHIVTDMWIDEADGTVKQQVDVLNTDGGKLINTLLEAGCKVGMSTRAEGELEEMEEAAEDGKKLMRVVPESYKYITTDFTADPSTGGTIPLKVESNMVKAMESALAPGDTAVDMTFVMPLLERMQGEEAKALHERLKGQTKSAETEIEEELVNFGVVRPGYLVKVKEGIYETVMDDLADKIRKITLGAEESRAGRVKLMTETSLSIELEDGATITITDPAALEWTSGGGEEIEPEDVGAEVEEELPPAPGDEELPPDISDEEELEAELGAPEDELPPEEGEEEELPPLPKKKPKPPFEAKDKDKDKDLGVGAGETKGDLTTRICDICGSDKCKCAESVCETCGKGDCSCGADVGACEKCGKVGKKCTCESAEESVDEEEGVSDVSKRMIQLQVEAAGAKAEKEKAIELVQMMDKRNRDKDSSANFETDMLSSRLGESASSRDPVEIAVLRERLEKAVSTIKTLREKISQIRENFAGQAKSFCSKMNEKDGEMDALREQTATKIMEAAKRYEDDTRRKFVKEYVTMKVDDSGMTLHESTRALLERCHDRVDVDKVFEEVIEATRASALHAGKGDLEVLEESADVDPAVAVINRRTLSVLEGISGIRVTS
jgi:hypothetical protein